MVAEYEIKKLMCEIGKRVYNNGFVAANDGNFSVRISDNEILATPTGVSKGYMTPDMICKVNMKGEVIQANGKYKPSSEIKMHIRVYEERADVKSVVHAHPPYGTSFAIAGIPLTKQIMPEATIFLGCIPIAEYGLPSTHEIPEAISKYLQSYDALLLENHGALTYGQDLMAAYFKMESLEFYAKLMYHSMMLGGPKELSNKQVSDLLDLRETFKVPGKHPGKLCLNNTCVNKEACDLKSGGVKGSKCECTEKQSNCKDKQSDSNDMSALVAEITKRVLKELNK
jgi:L-fuculose-phosphate aldolase